MNSGSVIVVWRKKSFISKVRKRSPRAESEMTLFRSIFVSIREVAGNVASWLYSNLSPPTVRQTLYFSCFKGLKLQTILAYVTFFDVGTSDWEIKVIQPSISSMPCARRPNSLVNPYHHVAELSPFRRESRDSLWPSISKIWFIWRRFVYFFKSVIRVGFAILWYWKFFPMYCNFATCIWSRINGEKSVGGGCGDSC